MNKLPVITRLNTTMESRAYRESQRFWRGLGLAFAVVAVSLAAAWLAWWMR